jgi:hypothetical protein
MARIIHCRILSMTAFAVWVCAGMDIRADDRMQLQLQLLRPAIPISQLHQIDRIVFGLGDGRLQIEYQLANKIYDLGSQYELNDSQKSKLKLAGRMEAKRFFFEVDQLRRDFDVATGNRDRDLQRFLTSEAQSLGNRRLKLFGADSFLEKVTANTTTEEQRLKYESALNERIRLRHRSNIEGAIRDIERKVVLKISQHEALVELLLRKISPPKRLTDFDETLVKYQTSQLPQQKLEPLFDADQWQEVCRVIEGFQKLKSHLVEQNLIDETSAAEPDAGEDHVAVDTGRQPDDSNPKFPVNPVGN